MYDRARAVFDAAMDVDRAEREAFVVAQSDGDDALCRLVLELIAEDEAEHSGFLEGGGAARAATEPDVEREIGPYRLHAELGRGGMGTVYRAEQREPIARAVAIKVIRSGLGTAQIVGRFEAERRALALMDHPNIARVLDAGATPAGRPFVVMELVDGPSITAYADAHDLDVAARVRLWIQVCEAVQHAHQKGMLHRDIKPSNVLVGTVDGRPVPKVIDFGLARALDSEGVVDVDLTRHDQVLGTPSYMSPEQAGAGAGDVDSRTDIYALGVLGFELLTGAPPLDRDTVSSSSWPELVRLIEERAAPRPSAVVAPSDPQRSRALRGDLDWIVQKALEKERDRRYSSASELAADLTRHLRREPVTAGPPSVGYRLQRFVARNRLVVVGVGVLLLALVAGLATTTWQAMRAIRAEQQEHGLRVRAERSQRIADAVNEFLIQVFRSADSREQGRDVKVVDRLAAGAESVEEQFADDPEVAAEILAAIGVTYRSLSMLDEAEVTLRRSLALWEQVPEARARRKAHALNALGILANRRGESDEAAAFFERALESFEASTAAAGLPEDRRQGLDDVARVAYNLAQLYLRDGKLAPAEPLFARCLAINRELFPDDHVRMGIVLGGQGNLRRMRGDYRGAEASYLESLERLRLAFDRPHPFLAVSLDNLSYVYWTLAEDAKVDRYTQEALQVAREVYDPEHNQMSAYLRRRADWLEASGDHAAAATLLRRCVAIQARDTGDESPITAGSRAALARSLLSTDAAAAQELAERAVDVLARSRSKTNIDRINAELVLALAHVVQAPDADVADLTAAARARLEASDLAPGPRALYEADLERIRTLAAR